MFKKNKSEEKPQAAMKKFLVLRSFYGIADHIALNDDAEKKIALCGYDSGIETTRFMNKIDVIDSIPSQHRGLFWCGECAEKVTGFDADTIRSYRRD